MSEIGMINDTASTNRMPAPPPMLNRSHHACCPYLYSWILAATSSITLDIFLKNVHSPKSSNRPFLFLTVFHNVLRLTQWHSISVNCMTVWEFDRI